MTMPDPTARDGEIIRLRNRTRALEAHANELAARAERAEAMTADSREQIERIQAERDAMPQDERARREAADAPLLRIQLAHYAGENERLRDEMERVVQSAAEEVWEKAGFNALIHWKGRAEKAEAERNALEAELALHVGCRVDISIGDALRLARAPESPTDAPKPVTAATEAHGGAGEAQEAAQ